jgi:hypothetical protein
MTHLLSCYGPRAPLPAATLVLMAALAACGTSKKPAGTDAVPAAPPAATAPSRAVVTACEMVTEAEMSRILGVAVAAKDHTHSSGETDCLYAAPSGFPAVELAVDWGDGDIAMRAAGMMNQREPGITSPYDGIGDQAIAVGPALMIKTGDDLVKLIFTGVDDAPVKAKKIFDTAKARM